MAQNNLLEIGTARDDDAACSDSKRAYQDALSETDPDKIKARTFDAQIAVLKRGTELAAHPFGREYQELDDAWRVLYRLESEFLNKEKVA